MRNDLALAVDVFSCQCYKQCKKKKKGVWQTLQMFSVNVVLDLFYYPLILVS